MDDSATRLRDKADVLRRESRLRAIFRRLRLYCKSWALFRERLARPALALFLPILPGALEVTAKMISGRSLRMKAGNWPLLASACRLEQIGAEVEFLVDAKRVTVDGLTLYSPLWSRDEASYYKEVLIDDVYGVKGVDLTGSTVVDVGAYVGDSTLAFARQGAMIHAFEPSVTFCGFIHRNLEANGLADRVVLHNLGLSRFSEDIRTRDDLMRFEEGVGYVLKHLPKRVDLLKLDCEGSEYYLLADPRFLSHLQPRKILMEYHGGPRLVSQYLVEAGYEVEMLSQTGPVGLISAVKPEFLPGPD